MVDANAGVVIDGSVELSDWARNLFDERYVLQAIDLTALCFGNRNYGDPKTFGVRASFAWKKVLIIQGAAVIGYTCRGSPRYRTFVPSGRGPSSIDERLLDPGAAKYHFAIDKLHCG